MKVLIDNGHGAETAGKCSPDGRLREWEFNRRLAKAIAAGLTLRGIANTLIVPEDSDVALRERCARVNALCGQDADCVLVSVHVNAASSGGWHNARGWCAFVAPEASDVSRALARNLVERAGVLGLGGNRSVPAQGYWTAPLAICRGTRCPAVLTENMFMDNRADLSYLLEPRAIGELSRLHIEVLEAFAKRI